MDIEEDRWVIVQRARRYPRGSTVVGVFPVVDSEEAMLVSSQLNAAHPEPIIDRFSKSTLYRWTPMRVGRPD